MSVNRRGFVRRAASVVAGATPMLGLGLGCSGPGDVGPGLKTAERVRWRLASSFPRSLDTIFRTVEVLAETLEEMTHGRFEIIAHAAGEVIPALQVMDAVQQGSVQVGHTASYYYTGKSPALAFDTGVPFGLTARQHEAWLLEAGGQELINEILADFNIVGFPAGNTGVQMGGWFRRTLESPADLKGLKMRIAGLGGEVMSRLGASVQVLASAEIYPALERGAIDATEWTGPYDDEKLGFYKIAKNYYYPGWWEPGSGVTLMVNRDAWDGLSAEYRAAFTAACGSAAAAMIRRYDSKNPPALKRLLTQGVKLRAFPESIMEAASRAARSLYQEQAHSDAAYRRVWEHWNHFRTESSHWFSTAELAYARFAFADP